MFWLLLLACAFIVAAAFYAGIRGFAAYRHETGHAWSQIEAQLQHRREVLQDLLEKVAEHFPHTHEVRRALDPQPPEPQPLSNCAHNESNLSHAVAQLLQWMETCPEEFMKRELEPLREALVKAEEKILFASQYHNAVAKAHNTKIRKFPHSLVAKCFRLSKLELFEMRELSGC